MKLNSVAGLALLAALTACNNNPASNATQPPSSGAPASTSPAASGAPVSTPDPSAPTVKESDAFPEGQYQIMLKKVNLTANAPLAKLKLAPAEQASYQKAATAAGGASHVHAGVKNGQLEFSADQSSEPAPDSHLSGNEPTISGPKGVPAKKIVATPEALKLMQSRAVE